VHTDNFTGCPDVIRRRGDGEIAEGVQADGEKNRQQAGENADEKESDFCVEVHGGVFRRGQFSVRDYGLRGNQSNPD
jgi:hypothetical protein